MSHTISCCGIVCSDCPVFQGECGGCNAVRGRPYWLRETEFDTCPLYACCVIEHDFGHCGQCSELPCDRFRELQDPSLSDAEHHAELQQRIAALSGL